jgi:hypothetical protein
MWGARMRGGRRGGMRDSDDVLVRDNTGHVTDRTGRTCIEQSPKWYRSYGAESLLDAADRGDLARVKELRRMEWILTTKTSMDGQR